jgi:DNA invertase Pin-like site-specific DNA recombinase
MSSTVIYCRTANSGVDEQEQQLKMLNWYSQKMGYVPIKAYCDWNTSGTTLDRPYMNRLLSEVRAGEVRRIVVKDLSRLARNFLLINELFHLFREYDVELVSMNDGGVMNVPEANKLPDAIWAIIKKQRIPKTTKA